MKRVLVITLLVVMAASLLAGCASPSTAQPEPQAEEAKKIGLVISTLNNPFFVTLKEGQGTVKFTERNRCCVGAG